MEVGTSQAHKVNETNNMEPIHVATPPENHTNYYENHIDSNLDYNYQDDYQYGDWNDDDWSDVENDNNSNNLHEYDLNGYNNDNEDATAKASRKLLISSIKHGGMQALYDDFVSIINSYNDGINELLFSHFRLINLLKKAYPIVSIQYDICSNGCKMYQPDEDADICDYCGQPRYNNKKRNNDGTPRNKQPRATV
ncbi:hypothetical protein BDA99DRAFT_565290 [Phascolomyces articulosus]|uniref:Uncharacterized protein n=1 Tax=Phascolomyces articulosus TaxID=60185 RepID=A0AAD5JP53_9FUNG|nr:hypothetical protein BDA99DRAFT_565290 [Phascolomyces articulosus]